MPADTGDELELGKDSPKKEGERSENGLCLCCLFFFAKLEKFSFSALLFEREIC